MDANVLQSCKTKVRTAVSSEIRGVKPLKCSEWKFR